MMPHSPAFPNEPNVEVQEPWGIGECSDGMTLHRYAKLVDLIVERFAKDDSVSVAIIGSGGIGVLGRRPKVDAIKLCGVRNYVTPNPHVSERNELRVSRTSHNSWAQRLRKKAIRLASSFQGLLGLGPAISHWARALAFASKSLSA